MIQKTFRMEDRYLRRIEAATGRHYKHTATAADPSRVILTQAAIEEILEDFLYIVEHKDKRWF